MVGGIVMKQKKDKQNLDEDTIIIHLGKVVSEKELQNIADDIAAFMSQRYPTLSKAELNKS